MPSRAAVLGPPETTAVRDELRAAGAGPEAGPDVVEEAQARRSAMDGPMIQRAGAGIVGLIRGWESISIHSGAGRGCEE